MQHTTTCGGHLRQVNWNKTLYAIHISLSCCFVASVNYYLWRHHHQQQNHNVAPSHLLKRATVFCCCCVLFGSFVSHHLNYITHIYTVARSEWPAFSSIALYNIRPPQSIFIIYAKENFLNYCYMRQA